MFKKYYLVVFMDFLGRRRNVCLDCSPAERVAKYTDGNVCILNFWRISKRDYRLLTKLLKEIKEKDD